MRVSDLARAIAPEAKIDVVGIRPGEKLHEVLISEDEARTTIDLGDRYAVLPPEPFWFVQEYAKNTTLQDGFRYASNTNDEWLTIAQIQEIIAPIEAGLSHGDAE
jgi:UDP-N-acetylglucosamine 4,6-dehydratase